MKVVLRVLFWLFLGLLAVLILLRIAAQLRESGAATPATTELVPTRSGKVAVTVTGPASGRPVLLIHGTAAWGGFWREVAQDLARRGYRAVAIDLPPFGYSDHDPAARYDRATQAARIADVAAHFGGRVVLVGHSFGAGAATETALRYPGRLSRLVLVDAALGNLDPKGGEGILAGVVGAPPVGQLVTSALVSNPMMTGTLLKSFMYRDEAADRWLDTLRQPMRRQDSTSAYAAWLPQLFVANDASLSRRRDSLRSIAVPVSIIWGQKDDVTPLAQGRELAALLRADSLQTLADVGHIPHVEDPAAFNRALAAALAEPARKR